MKRSMAIGCIAVLLFLTGCRMEFHLAEEKTGEEQVIDAFKSVNEVTEKPTNEDGEINTKIHIIGELRGSKKLTVIGHSNLPEGAVLTIIFQEFNDDPELVETDILEGAEPTGPKTFEDDVIVEAEGEFSTSFLHRNNSLMGKLTVTFKPERQNAELKAVYGPHGENILNEENGNGIIKYEKDGVEHTGYQVYGASDYFSANSQLWEDYNAMMAP